MSKHKKTKQLTGTVKWFDPSRGIGYITMSDGSNVFVRYTSLPICNGRFVPLVENQDVSFEIQDGFNGPQAVNIKILTQKSAK